MADGSGVVTGLAIDFGTSNTAAAYRDASGQVRELRLSTTGSLMPSAVVYNGPGQILVGRTAVQAAHADPDRFEPTPKRRLVDQDIRLGGTPVAVPELVAAVYAQVVTRARQEMGAEPDEVVITHPDQWGPRLQQTLRSAAQAGGVDPQRMRLVSEAQAAAWFYAATAGVRAGARLVVFDFGAGTCDVAVLNKRSDGSFAVVASEGEDGLGGHDIDARIHKWVRQQLTDYPALLAEIDDPNAVATRLTLNDRIRDAKEALSEAASATIVITGAPGIPVLTLTQKELDSLIGADIDRAVDLTKRVIATANARQPSDQTPTIYLTGGSSHIPLVHARLSKLGPLGALGDPKTVVVHGALHTPSAPPPPPEPPQAPPPDEKGGGRKRIDSFIRNTRQKVEESVTRARDNLAAPRPTAVAPAPGSQFERPYTSRLSLAQPSIRPTQTMQITEVQLGVHDEFSIVVSRLPVAQMLPGALSAHIQRTQAVARQAGWVTDPLYPATVAGIGGGQEHWQTPRFNDGGQRRILQAYARRGPYLATVWIGEAYIGVRDKIVVEAQSGATSLVNFWAKSMSVPIIVDGVDPQRVTESLSASISIDGISATLRAELSPGDVAVHTAGLKHGMAARSGVTKMLVSDDRDVFFGGRPCSAFRFEWHPVAAAPAVVGVVTTWVWLGALDGRVATITLESRNPGAPAGLLRDLAVLADAPS